MAMNKAEVMVMNALIDRVQKLTDVVYSYQLVFASMPKIVSRNMEPYARFARPKALRHVELAPQPSVWDYGPDDPFGDDE